MRGMTSSNKELLQKPSIPTLETITLCLATEKSFWLPKNITFLHLACQFSNFWLESQKKQTTPPLKKKKKTHTPKHSCCNERKLGTS